MTEPIKVHIIDDEQNETHVSAFNELLTAQRHTDVSLRFEYGISTDFDVNVSATGTASITTTASMAVTRIGSGIGLAKMQSKRAVEYSPAHEIQAFFTARFTLNGDTASYQRIGLFDPDDGFFIGYHGSTFGVGIRTEGTTTFTPQTSFNRDTVDGSSNSKNPSGFNLDHSKLVQYRITYGWLGVAPVTIAVYGGKEKGFIPLHVYDYSNNSFVPSISSPCAYMTMECGRSASSGNTLSLFTASWGAGSTSTHNMSGFRPFTKEFDKTIGAGVTTYVGSLLNKTTFNNKNNKIRTDFSHLFCSTDGTKNVTFRFLKNAVLGGTSYQDIDTNNAVMAFDISGTYSASSDGKLVFSIPVAKVDTIAVETADESFYLLPGENLTVVATSTGASETKVTLRWRGVFS